MDSIQIYTIVWLFCYSAVDLEYKDKPLEGAAKTIFRFATFAPILGRLLEVW